MRWYYSMNRQGDAVDADVVIIVIDLMLPCLRSFILLLLLFYTHSLKNVQFVRRTRIRPLFIFLSLLANTITCSSINQKKRLKKLWALSFPERESVRDKLMWCRIFHLKIIFLLNKSNNLRRNWVARRHNAIEIESKLAGSMWNFISSSN